MIRDIQFFRTFREEKSKELQELFNEQARKNDDFKERVSTLVDGRTTYIDLSIRDRCKMFEDRLTKIEAKLFPKA